MENIATLKPLKPPRTTAAAAQTLRPTFAMRSHPGRVRHNNQDACAALPEIGAYVVCDGVGGAAAGEVASQLAAQTLLHHLSHPDDAVANPPDSAPGTTQTERRIRQAVHAANHAVFQKAQRSRTLRGMGTTLVALLWEDPAAGSFWLAHVGDSRCYLFRQGQLQLLTEDHSLVEEQIRAGQLSRAQAETSPIRNIITRAVGTQPAVEPDLARHVAKPGDLILLASDGVTRELDDSAIAGILHTASITNLDAVCEALIEAANAAGGRDNSTVLLVACT
jgi:serine/threonine protein phosphatase PrpC